MTLSGWVQIFLLSAGVVLCIKPFGCYLYWVYERPTPIRFPLIRNCEAFLFQLCGISQQEQDWKSYTGSLLIFSLVGVLIIFTLQRFQHWLPFNPQSLPPVPWDLALNTAVSFVTNTNWQAYAGETTLSMGTQMIGLTWQNFVSAASGIAVALAFARGLTRRTSLTQAGLGNFWVDIIRTLIYVLLPLSLLVALIFIGQGVIQNFSANLEITTLEGAQQILPMGPVASQEAIKILGTNGGGFFNANSAHPFENPTAFTNFLQMFLILLIPASLTYTYGKMAGDQRQGWSIFAAMAILFLISVFCLYASESQPNPALNFSTLSQSEGNLEGKELRFGVPASILYSAITTATSCGAVNSMHSSLTALGGLCSLLNILLGEVVFGGVGSGLFGMLIFVILSVFIAGLMVGRTPEYLGKKIEVTEIKFATLYIILFAFMVLAGASWSVIASYAVSSIQNHGPHGLTEIFYAYASATGNNGSVFAGLNANTVWFNLSLAFVMFVGRFAMMALVLAIAGSMVQKKLTPKSLGTFQTHGVTFVILLIGVILTLSALTFFPVLSLGPIAEHLMSLSGKVF
jgi:K+-transporting ATPase ATPase A chain